MILESMMQDTRAKVTFDCCKATMSKGDTIEVLDEFYNTAEIQGAIKLGLVRVVGEPPAAVAKPTTAEERRVKLRSRATNKMAFDCIKGSVDPNEFIWIPESKLDHIEIRNALDTGMLEDPESKVAPATRTSPVDIEEVQIVGPSEPRQTERPRQRQGRKASVVASPIKAKQVSSSNNQEASEAEDTGFFAESKIIEPKGDSPLAGRRPHRVVDPIIEPEPKKDDRVDDTFSFLDVFGGK